MNQASQGIRKNLNAGAAVDAPTGDELLPLVYNELRRLAAAQAMRQILVERARWRMALKRAGGVGCLSLDESEMPPVEAADDERLLAVDEALEQFAAYDPRKAELVKLRYFIGMSFEEAASVLGIAVPTAKKWWAYGRAWLAVALRPFLEDAARGPSQVSAGLGEGKKV